jgi:hypothetical protein
LDATGVSIVGSSQRRRVVSETRKWQREKDAWEAAVTVREDGSARKKRKFSMRGPAAEWVVETPH